MTNPFTLFDLPVSFELDLRALNERYLTLQKALHPDKFSASSNLEQRLAMQKSAEINDALQTLKDPILRAECLIALYTGKKEDIEQKSNHDMTFLLQQMHWREELEEIEKQQDQTKLVQFLQTIEQEKQHILTTLSSLLANAQWQQASAQTDKLRFIQKLLLEVERVEEKLAGF